MRPKISHFRLRYCKDRIIDRDCDGRHRHRKPADPGEPMSAPLIVAMGVSGSGKSTVGAALAQRLRVPFADADLFHPAANVAKMTAGHALDDDDRRPWLESIGEWLAAHAET